MNSEIRFLTAVVAVCVAALMSPIDTQARVLGWAKRLPINQYTGEDIEIVKKTMAEILNHGEDGEAGEWSNPETGHAGSITPLTTTQQNDKVCRQTRFTSLANGAENTSEFFLCKQADGVWAVEQPEAQ